MTSKIKDKKELEKEILEKVEIIKENILTGKGPSDPFLKNHMLALVSDDLSEVLLNWEDDDDDDY